MKIVAFGDSITYGDTGDHGEPHPRRWTTLLAEKTGHEVVNKGVNGDTTRLALERFPADVQESGADVVLIQFGYNDCNHWDTDRTARVSIYAFQANLTEMWERAHRFKIDAVFVGMHPTRRGGVYDNWAKEYAQVFTSGHKLPSGYRRIPPPCPLELPDGLHLSDRDHALYADQIAAAL